jgi:Tfp pilus assembly pilus retraction ATPase PilT
MTTSEADVQAVASHTTLDPDTKHDPHATRFGKFLQACIKFKASDLIIKAGSTPKIRVRGSLKALDTEVVSQEEFMRIAEHILTEEQWADIKRNGSADFAYDYDEENRFRVNLFQARGRLAVACRLITSNIMVFKRAPPAGDHGGRSRCSRRGSCCSPA